MGVKTKKIVEVIYYLLPGALLWRFQICIDHPILVYLILRNVEWQCPTNYLLL